MTGSRVAGMVRGWSGELWLLLQATAAATVAWVIAKQIGDHSNPFFAPIAAVVALSFGRGERGLSAMRLLAGVGIGITAGELMVILLGGGYWSLALAILIAVMAARSLGANRLLRNQAAAAAVLTVAVADGHAGFDRLVDALIGAGVALAFTQILFTPLPIALVRRAEAAAITSMSEGLRLIADAIERGDHDLAELTAERLRVVRDQLSELARAVRASRRVVRHSLLWRAQSSALEPVRDEAGRLDLLGAGCLMLMRTAVAVSPSQGRILLDPIRQLAAVLAELATDLEDPEIRQRAADSVHRLIRQFVAGEESVDVVMAGAIASVRILAYDLMVFAGIDEYEAANAAQKAVGELPVRAPTTSRIRFTSRLSIGGRLRRPQRRGKG